MLKDMAFNLQKPLLDAFEKLKTLIASAPILKIVNPTLPIKLKVHANSKKIGAILEQKHGPLENPKWRPIGYLSRIFRDYEKKIVQIEKYSHSIVFGVERFHE